jgi:hypothetical protein
MSLRLLFVGLLLALAGCGGPTGLSVVLAVPPEFKAGVDYDLVQVQVITGSNQVIGDPPYPVTAATELPLRVIVWLGEERQTTVTLVARLLKGNEKKLDDREGGVTFEPGQLKEVVVDFR